MSFLDPASVTPTRPWVKSLARCYQYSPLPFKKQSIKAAKKLTDTKFVLIACMPKSGSTFIANNLACLPSWRKQSLKVLSPANICNLYSLRANTVFQSHLYPTDFCETRKTINEFPFHIVVLTRNIQDVIPSTIDHWDKYQPVKRAGWIDKGQFGQLLADKLDREGLASKVRFVALCMLPWYLEFFASWSRFSATVRPVQFLRYEDWIANPKSTLFDIASAVDGNVSITDIERVMSRSIQSRFNRGIAGRGDMVPAELRDHLELLMSYYPDVDFSPVYNFRNRTSTI